MLRVNESQTPLIIGLHGRLQSGKDTTFERIQRYFDGIVPVERLSFADPLKDSAAALLDVSREELERMKLADFISIVVRVPGSDDPNNYRTIGYTGRQYLQRYGTEAHRDVFGDSFWVDQALAKATNRGTLYVITDVRFPNEVEAIRDAGGVLAHVVGPEGKAAGGHSSEQALPDHLFNFEIDNTVRDDGFANLDRQVKKLFASLVLTRVCGARG